MKKILYLLIILLLANCATVEERTPESYEYVWPMPPLEPKIRFERSLWGEEDITKAAPTEIILGREPSTDLIKPYGLFVDLNGVLYVTDTSLHSVFVFDIPLRQFRIIGRKELFVPADVAVDEFKNRIYVSDTGRQEILVFDDLGRLIKFFGKGKVRNPAGMAIDTLTERLFVASIKTHTIEVFNLDGKYLYTIGGRGNAPGMFNMPT
ncbi:MAG: hypothetical protein D6778_05255, partial [Nitrospirae bacterium]